MNPRILSGQVIEMSGVVSIRREDERRRIGGEDTEDLLLAGV